MKPDMHEVFSCGDPSGDLPVLLGDRALALVRYLMAAVAVGLPAIARMA